jgi:DNA polymerase elongation subunit (family B)
MLVDVEYRNNNLIISYIDKTGQIKLRYKPWSRPTKFITTGDDDPEKSGRFVTWDGRSVKEIYTKYPNKYSIYDFIDNLPAEEREEIYSYNEPDIFFVDIENEILDKKPEPHLAESAIQTISIVNKNKILVIGTEPLNQQQIESIESDINNHFKKFETKYLFKYIQYKNEYDLLFNFFNKLVPKMPVITGWNFIDYDWVFLVARARRIGVDPDVSSFTKKMNQPFNQPANGKFGNKANYAEIPAHRVIVDYMELFTKWDTSIKVKESQSLDFVSEKVLGNEVKKVNYEGDLKRLHREDYKKFVFYNAVDSCLVQRIHIKMKYVDILYGMAVLGKIRIKDAISTLALTEGILREKLRDQKNIVLVRDEQVDDFGDTASASIKGGWVKEPVRGMATWTCCFDFASLYPTTMRQFNISADSYKGQQVKGKNYSIFNGHQLMIADNDIVTLNGSVFKNEVGVVTQVMGEVYSDRKKWKKVMFEKHEELEKLKEELKKLQDEPI